MTHKTTHFGFREVPVQEKTGLVAQVFDSVAPKYDLMNDLMSFGMHRLWKQFTIDKVNPRPGQIILDLASGTGDLAKILAKKVGKNGKVTLADINPAMLNIARDRLTNAGIVGNVEYIETNAETLPFENNTYDCITIAFGLRNVTDKDAALSAMYRVLKPGGKLLVLEFSHANSKALEKLYDLYSFNIIPRIGQMVLNDKKSYEYLVESIRMHPNQEKLKSLLENAGFEDVSYFNLCGGIVALHLGYKY